MPIGQDMFQDHTKTSIIEQIHKKMQLLREQMSHLSIQERMQIYKNIITR